MKSFVSLVDSLLAQQNRCARGNTPCRGYCRRCNRSRDRDRRLRGDRE